MLRNLAWQLVDDVARAQLAMFHAVGDKVSLTEDDRRRALGLDDGAWAAWTDFLAAGSLPTAPPLPEMLQRLGQTSYNLSVLAEGA